MYYLMETYTVYPATPKTMETFIGNMKERYIPEYKKNSAVLIMAWSTSSTDLGKITQLFELNDINTYQQLLKQKKDNSLLKKIELDLDTMVNEKHSQLLEEISPLFRDNIKSTIAQSKPDEMREFTLAVLQVSPEYMDEFSSRLEKGIEMGHPMVTGMRSLTGKLNTVFDIWKINMMFGYQPQEFYNQFGFTEDFFKDMRRIAPKESMEKIFPLPYSPIR